MIVEMHVKNFYILD